MTYTEVLDYLYSRLPMYQRIGAAAFKKDLTNTLKLCHSLNNPQDNFKSIHIAGTNGKGSSSHMIAAVLQMAGYKTGLYTSPHLKDFTERIRINGVPITPPEVISFVETARTVIDEVNPSFFELTVAMAFDHFQRNKVDISVIETGLGGRFDSTNVITPLVSLITNISFDHQDLLGNTLPEIAFEKAGIIKPGVPVVIGDRHIETENVFLKKSREVNAPVIFAEDQFSISKLSSGIEPARYEVIKKSSGKKIMINTDLPGDYQVRNIPPVLSVLELLRDKEFIIPDEAITNGLAGTTTLTGLKGRWQVLSADPFIVCDVAHNEDGIKWVIQQLHRLQPLQLHVIFGMVKDKDPDSILKKLPPGARYYFCQANIPRAKNAGELAGIARNYGLNGLVYDNVNQALESARSNYKKGDIIFIGGSTFIIAELDIL
jgi:dihydrofolate synthase/folylpolyglutamate synthase